MTVTPKLLALSELDPDAQEQWASLADSAVEANPFLHPEFVLPAARAQDVLDKVSLAVGTDDGRWVACLPVRSTRSWRRLPLPGTLAWIHAQCFLGTPLLDAADAPAAAAGLVEGMTASRTGAFAEFDHADTQGPAGRALDSVLPDDAMRFGRYERPALFRRETPDYLDGRIKGKHRRSLNRQARDLSELLGGPLELVDRAGDPEAVEQFLALESAGWKGQSRTALAHEPGGPEFFRAMCRDFASRGALQLLFLTAGTHTVAARCNLRSAEVILCFKIAHDEGLRRFSPGMQLELRMIDHFHGDPTAVRMDSCADPGSVMFNRLWADRRALGGILLPSPLAGRAAAPALRSVGRAIDRRRTPAAA